MAKVTDDLFDKAVNETSFAIPTEGRSKSSGSKTPLVQGEYLGHIVQVNSKVVDVKGGEFKARVYDYFVEVAPENKDNEYTYKKYDTNETVTCDGNSYVGYKFKGSTFKYLEPGKGDTFKSRTEFNKYYLWFCEACNIECKTITTEIDGKDVEVKELPIINMEELVGTPVSAVVGKGKTWTDSDGNERTPWVSKFVRPWKDGVKKEMDNEIPF
tara:strand:+ start:1610 stop:2248 length:639 start_codon:yes stop_codon:yes gene_type:complete